MGRVRRSTGPSSMAPVGHRGMGPPGTAAERAAGARLGSARLHRGRLSREPGLPLLPAELKGLLSAGAVPTARLPAPDPPGATRPP